MKQILLAIAMLILSIPSTYAFTTADEMNENHKPVIIIRDKKIKEVVRNPVVYDTDIYVGSVNNTLSITFTGYVPDAIITVTDVNSNTVIQQTLVTITSGMTLYVTPDNSYPYNITIISPTLDILGEIIDDQN